MVPNARPPIPGRRQPREPEEKANSRSPGRYPASRDRGTCRASRGRDATVPEIGVVGLGRMGLPTCVNLVRADYQVLAGDRRPEAARQAAGCGARWVPELARVAAEAGVLITVLPGAGEVRELMLGPGGAAAALRRGSAWIDMTSNSPAAVTEIRDALLDRGVQVLDAPAGGGVAAARQGTFQLQVGGQAEVVARHRDLLEILGRPGRVVRVGGYGAGYTAKLLINLVWFGQAVATAEALLLVHASGLDLGCCGKSWPAARPARSSSAMTWTPCSPATSCAPSAWTAAARN